MIGAIFLAYGFFYTYRIIESSPPYSKHWKILLTLIIFFILGYIIYAILALKIQQAHLDTVEALIFLGSGIFVFLITNLSLKTITKVKHITKLQYESEHDGLTGIYNTRFFQKQLKILINQVKRGGPNGVLMFIDLDKFKCINDTYGHLAGDTLLAKIATILTRAVRKADIVARIGGDEFVIILYNTTLKHANIMISRATKKIKEYANNKFKHCKNFGCSTGCAVIDENSKDVNTILSQADRACYKEKNGKKR
ncbi:MAG: GGDEF domain-containing protein [Gammaproteobacteria bacterium]|jgi:diguanylate cyclase (GGDEF)-like protein